MNSENYLKFLCMRIKPKFTSSPLESHAFRYIILYVSGESLYSALSHKILFMNVSLEVLQYTVAYVVDIVSKSIICTQKKKSQRSDQ